MFPFACEIEAGLVVCLTVSTEFSLGRLWPVWISASQSRTAKQVRAHLENHS